MFVVIEGPDGCGKSTHAARLRERLNAKFFKFPNALSESGKLIYEHLEHKWNARFVESNRSAIQEHNMNALIFQSLQSLNRVEMAENIKKARMSGDLVVDRYWPSGYAYGKADGLSGQYLIDIHTSLPQPDLFLLLDIDIQDSLERRPERRDRYESNIPFMSQVMENYRSLWAREMKSSFWKVINARGTHEETAKKIEDAIAWYREKA